MGFIIKCFKSKTLQVALIMSILTTVELNLGAVSALLPEALKPYLILSWPSVMIVMRFITTEALTDK